VEIKVAGECRTERFLRGEVREGGSLPVARYKNMERQSAAVGAWLRAAPLPCRRCVLVGEAGRAVLRAAREGVLERSVSSLLSPLPACLRVLGLFIECIENYTFFFSELRWPVYL